MKRRELMIGTGGVATALLSGRIPDVAAQNDKPWQQGAMERPETAIELLPPESRLDSEYVRILETTVEDTDDLNLIPYGTTVTDSIDDFDSSEIESIAVGWISEQRVILTVSGSFDRIDLGERVSGDGDSRVGNDDSEGVTIASTDGLLLLVDWDDRERRIDVAETGIQVGNGFEKSVVDRIETLAVAFDHFGDKKVFYYVPTIGDGVPTEVDEQLETISAGFEISPVKVPGYDGTLENEFLLQAAENAALTSDDVAEIVRELEQGTVIELESEFDDESVFVETVIEAPPERNQESAPDAQVNMNGDPDEGVAVLEHSSGETIDADNLELWVNGELTATQPAGEFDAFEPGDSVTIQSGPLASVYLRWVDESTNEYFEYVNDVVGTDAFETNYDVSAGTVELTYTAEADVNPELLALEHRWKVNDGNRTQYERERVTEPIAVLGDTLSKGDSIVVEGVGLEETVTLELDVQSKPPGTFGLDTTLARVRTREPRFFIHRKPDEAPVVEYLGRTVRDADEFRILTDGEEAEIQLADRYDTLERGDQVSLDATSFGTEVLLEWTGGSEPQTVEKHVLKPLIDFDINYDDSEGTVTVEHLDGEDVDANELELLVDGDLAETQPGGRYDVFSKGDTVTVPAEPFTPVRVRWVDDSTELTLSEGGTGSQLLKTSYDPSTRAVELTYIGQQAANPGRIGVQRHNSPDAGLGQPFAEAYETLTAGDSVTIEDVDPEAVVQVVLTQSDDSPEQTLFSFRPEPNFVFEFENRNGTLTAVYQLTSPREADAFRILADGTEIKTQPDDKHDVLEQGDEIELGSFAPETTLVVEWPVGNDPSEIQRHFITPDADFEASYDAETGEVRVEHAGGDEIEATALTIYVPQVTEQPVEWDGDNTISKGDSTTVEVAEKPEAVVIIYRGQELLAELGFES